jgi:hypothetical protein
MWGTLEPLTWGCPRAGKALPVPLSHRAPHWFRFRLGLINFDHFSKFQMLSYLGPVPRYMELTCSPGRFLLESRAFI